MGTQHILGVPMSRRKNSAMRREQEQYDRSNKNTQTFYQKHENTINFSLVKHKKQIELLPKSQSQESYILSLLDSNTDIVVATGPAGTGKTYLAMLAAIQALRNREVDKIVLTRPAVGVDDEKHGFLPGDLNSKMEPWTRPLLDVLKEHYSAKECEYMLSEGIVEISPLAFMRGRTFKESFIILDEAQNATPSQIKMLMTRIGYNSKIVITGDIEQTDRRRTDNGLLDLEDRLYKHPVSKIDVIRFELKDVQRHPIIEDVIRLYSV